MDRQNAGLGSVGCGGPTLTEGQAGEMGRLAWTHSKPAPSQTADLHYTTSESSLQKEFSNFGQIAEVKLIKDGATNRSKGYAFIQYMCQEDAMLALENMDYKNFDGRVIYVELAKPGRDALGRYPITSGPPEVRRFHGQDDVPDCWY
ncbi:Glycine-rich RNA-binding protein 4, mitochondrial [Morella rubra]|uniref:Glycine-rich RNA-binding protein 4, mitochondrial n=1 Tax=Morella rubra TaxID=262757 RepID=A0A6A1UJW0_9ROSI|nr:Glycine-rich RNA-binding protein 4, mitochondrial [Morella rubra]